MKTALLVDGENLKSKIKSILKENKLKPIWHEYKFKNLFDRVLSGMEINKKIFYFARIKESKYDIKKSKQLIQDQRLLKTSLEKQGFEFIISGRVRGQIENTLSGRKVLIFKEKGVDVKIAVDMVSFSCDKKVDQIILASSDSDMQPAVKEVRERKVKCVYLGFETNPNKGLSYTSDKTILIRDSEILEFNK